MGYARVPNGIGSFVIQFPTFLNNNNLVSSQLEHTSAKKIIKITDIIGREIGVNNKKLLLYIYDDGTVERKYINK